VTEPLVQPAATASGGTSSGYPGFRAGVADLLSVERLVIGLLLLFLAWEIVIPLVALVWSALKDVRPDDAAFFDPDFTFSNIGEVLDSGSLWSTTWNTIQFSFGSSLLALVMGGILAFVTTRTNAVLKWLIASLVLYQLAMPDVLYPVVWTFLLGPDLGALTDVFAGAFGSSPFDIYSMGGMIWVESFLLLPLVYIFMVPAISAMDRSLEEAAETSGANRAQVMRDIVLKLAVPALVATLVIALMRSWEAFEVPWFLGVRESTFTFSTELFFQTTTPPSDTGVISSFALPMLAVSLVMVWWYNRFNLKARNFAVLTGKGYKPTLMQLKRPTRWLVSGGCLLVLFLGVVLPFLMLIWLSLHPFYAPPSLEALGNIQFDSYARALETPAILTGFKNSLIIGIASSLLVLLVVSLSSWFVVHGRMKGRRLLDVLTFAPMAFPNIIVGICLLWLYLLLPIDLSGTFLVLILAYFILFVAIAARNVTVRTLQIHPELHEAAISSGAGFLTSYRTVILPLMGPALLASGLYITAWAFKELETTLLLAGNNTKTTTVVVYDLTGLATTSEVAAVGVIAVGGLLLVIGGFQIAARRMGIAGF
jgi:iron(III) transport system permease protein